MGYLSMRAVLAIWNGVTRRGVEYGDPEMWLAWFVVILVVAAIVYPFWHFVLGW
jgi:hypothetical protein